MQPVMVARGPRGKGARSKAEHLRRMAAAATRDATGPVVRRRGDHADPAWIEWANETERLLTAPTSYPPPVYRPDRALGEEKRAAKDERKKRGW